MKNVCTALSLAILAAACASAPEADPAEVFRLVSVGEEPLPVSYPEEQGCREEVVEASLALLDGGEWTMTMAKREVCGGAVEEDQDREAGTYSSEGGMYRFTGPPSTAGVGESGEIEIESLVAGTLRGDELTARLQDGTAVVFRRSRGAGGERR